MSMELRPFTNEVALKANRLNDSLFSPEHGPYYMELAQKLAKSTMIPKHYIGKPMDLFIAMAMAYQVGLSVEQGIQCIAVINGRACMWGDDMLALCMVHPEWVDIIEEPIMDGRIVLGYKCTVKRKGMRDHIKEFTLDMAKRAKLLTKPGPWQEYPERMMQLRARAFALRDRFPDALKGIKSREEVEDYIEAEFSTSGDSKLSRTELIKQELQSRKEIIHDKINTPMEDKPTSQEAASNFEPSEMANPGEQEALPQIPNLSLTSEQAIEINKLIEEKAFTDERIQKALDYYEVTEIGMLTYDLAEDFIQRLHKA